jgi:L-malate glycosyltransferase
VSKLRVMQLVLSLSPGGTERLVIEIVRALAGRIDFVVCCLDEPGSWASEVEALQVPVVALSRRPGFQPRLAVHLARVMKAHQIDVVHCHHYSPFVYGVLASLLKPATQLVFTEHGKLSGAGPSRKRRWVNPLLSRRHGHLRAVSADLRRHMLGEGFQPERLSVLYNGIEPGERPSKPQRDAARKMLGLSPEAFVIGTAGRLDPVKNLDLLLQTHAALTATHEHAHTVIVGDGPERTALEAKAAALGVSGSLSFAGYRSDVRSLIPAFDVFLNCSAYEGVSLTILEAMAAGLPVVATPVGGNPEVVVDQHTGFLIPPSATALAVAIKSLANDQTRRVAMGEAGRRRVEQHFSIGRMVQEYADLYFGLNPAEVAGYTFSANANSAR